MADFPPIVFCMGSSLAKPMAARHRQRQQGEKRLMS
jgi:hypothetical protein